jgi:RHS repeat-associated protein
MAERSTLDEYTIDIQSISDQGSLRVRGTLDEPGSAKVNGQPAGMLSGNVFEATIQASPGTNAFTVQATDTSGNVTSKSYEVEVTAAGASYSYDSNGNLATKAEGSDTWGYEWNARNELTRVTKNSVEQARFAYDAFGRRVEKVAGGVTTTYTYDGDNILREVRGSTTLKYVHGPAVDEPLAVDDGTALTYFHVDGLASIVQMTNGSGAVTLTRQYDAWGNLEAGVNEPGLAFTGREWDPETSFYYYRARYYDPKVGRFISEDPIRFAAGPNFYSYVSNRPTVLTDPFGLLDLAGGVGIGVFGVFSQVFGVAGGGDVKFVADSSGNFGVMVCGTGGLAVGEAGGGGVAVTGTIGSGCIRDLEGLSVQVEGGGGAGGFAKGSAGGYMASNSAGVVGSVGLGAGLGGYGAVEAVGCRIIWSRRP